MNCQTHTEALDHVEASSVQAGKLLVCVRLSETIRTTLDEVASDSGSDYTAGLIRAIEAQADALRAQITAAIGKVADDTASARQDAKRAAPITEPTT